jgi:hypothetical protein
VFCRTVVPQLVSSQESHSERTNLRSRSKYQSAEEARLSEPMEIVGDVTDRIELRSDDGLHQERTKDQRDAIEVVQLFAKTSAVTYSLLSPCQPITIT